MACEQCKQLEAQRNALLAALRVYHDDGEDGALLRKAAETLWARADGMARKFRIEMATKGWPEDHPRAKQVVAIVRHQYHLADQLIEKHAAACKAIAKAEEK